MQKLCSKCGRTLGLEWFGKNKNTKDGLQFWCRDCRTASVKSWRDRNRDAVNAQSRERYSRHKKEGEPASTRYRRLLREAAISHYGGKCACCGESAIEFLCIDHVDGGGTKHRKSLGRVTIYSWLKKHKYPAGFRILCWNCNSSLGLYGYSPKNRNFR